MTISIWPWFISRLGKLAWQHTQGANYAQDHKSLEGLLANSKPHLILVDEGVRIRTNSGIWNSEGLLLVISLTDWKGTPPRRNWSCSTKTFSHQELGGVTSGRFPLYFACHLSTKEDLRFPMRRVAPARLGHVLDPTTSGVRCPVPGKGATPLGQTTDGLLHWERRFSNVEAPTVFTSKHWVRRRLGPKELVSVLDLPVDRMRGVDRTALVREVGVPGKVRARVVDEVREWIAPYHPSHKRERPQDAEPTKRRKLDMPVPPTAAPAPGATERAPTDTVTVKSAKADDASVPIYLWDNQCLEGLDLSNRDPSQLVEAFRTMRKCLLRKWKVNVGRDFRKWMIAMDEAKAWQDSADRAASVEAGEKALFYSSQASWWEWTGGSFPFFWRWAPKFMREIRDGMPPRFVHEPPACMDRQRPNPNPEFARKEREKVLKVIKRGYLIGVALGLLRSLMHYFSVPKGEDDIRMVYNGSKCLLNAATFAPWFAVPTASTLKRTVMPHTVQADNDYQDMFLNFQLHKEMQKYAGVDVMDLLKDDKASKVIRKFSKDASVYVAWDRPAMGLTGSPYQAVQTTTRGKRVILGDRLDPKNPFRWDEVVVNAPGDHDYDPTLPWVFKRRLDDGCIGADLHTYIDDNRSTGNSNSEAWSSSSRIAKCCLWLGMQDAARKRRAPSNAPGAWAGTIIQTDGKRVEKLVSQERWDKTRKRLGWIDRQWRNDTVADDLDSKCPKGHLPHKQLESIRGFLVYVSRTYPEFVPYLKGIHLTLDSWRKGRAFSGWKSEVADQDLDNDYEGCNLTNVVDDKIESLEMRRELGVEKAPFYVKAVPRLRQDLGTLLLLTKFDKPPAVLVRPTNTIIGYLMGDALGSGHGTRYELADHGRRNVGPHARNLGDASVQAILQLP